MGRLGWRLLCVGRTAVLLTSAVVGGTQSGDQARAQALTLIEKAEAATAAGRHAESVELLEAAERLQPEWAELKVNLAAARSQVGDYAGAAAAARAALDLKPSLDGARFNLGLALLKSGDSKGAAAALAQYATSAAPPEVHAALGLAWMRLDRPADAAPVLQRAIDAGLMDRDTLLAAGRAWLRADELARARATAEILEESAEEWAETHLLAGDIADAGQDWAAAQRHYSEAIARRPGSPQAHYSLGLVLYKQREYDRSAAALAAALRLAPDYVPAQYYLALLELDRGNAAAGAKLLNRAAVLAPDRSDVARDLGRARIDLGDFTGAIAALRRAIELSPDDPSAWFLLGRALQRTGAKAESAAALARAVELNQLLRDRLEKKISGRHR